MFFLSISLSISKFYGSHLVYTNSIFILRCLFISSLSIERVDGISVVLFVSGVGGLSLDVFVSGVGGLSVVVFISSVCGLLECCIYH